LQPIREALLEAMGVEII